jgi:plastocyanin
MVRFLACLFVLSASAGAAVLEGVVDFDGKVPEARSVPVERDPVCSTVFPGGLATDQPVTVDAAGGLANVFVVLTAGVDAATVPPAPAEPIVLDQKQCRFLPRVVGVRAGQPVRVGNGDHTLHNVRAEASKNRQFNVGLAPGKSVERVFDAAERMVRLHCHVHRWMTAWVGVVEHPYYAVTDARGRFRIENVPPGRYDVEAWHETLGTRKASVVVPAAGKVGPIAFHFTAEGRKAR